MILIISQNIDPSTDKVIDWVHYFGKSYYRLNGEDIINYNSGDIKIHLSTEQNMLSFNENVLSNKIASIWFRRDSYGHFKNNIPHVLSNIVNEGFYEEVSRNLYEEYLSSKFGLYSLLEHNRKTLGNFRKFSVNKMEILLAAKANGLDIPNSFVTNSKLALIDFINANGCVITKSISEGFGLTLRKNNLDERYLNYTEEIDERILKKLPDNFFTSLFQEKLDKDIEIRTYLLDGRFYSMAIFSQLDQQTQVDFRKYNKENNNRNVPYKLPTAVENNIRNLMGFLNLNTGSIDIVKTKNNRFVFLEVNPVGQYDMISVPCNYNLDMLTAKFLSENE